MIVTVPTEIRFDHYGRYVLPHPETATEQSWTRATTLAKAISDDWALKAWEGRMVASGLARRPDLIALAAATPIPVRGQDGYTEGKRTLNEIVGRAKEAAKSSAGANIGSALHAATASLDRGEEVTLPEPYQADLEIYRQTLWDQRIDVLEIEQIVVLPSLGVAGTFDRIVSLPDVGPAIADLKTGSVEYSWLEISIQLALYAHASHIWRADRREYDPAPAVNQARALVIHLPAGEARCDLYSVDIASGWEAAQLCGQIRDWRGRKNLARPAQLKGAP